MHMLVPRVAISYSAARELGVRARAVQVVVSGRARCGRGCGCGCGRGYGGCAAVDVGVGRGWRARDHAHAPGAVAGTSLRCGRGRRRGVLEKEAGRQLGLLRRRGRRRQHDGGEDVRCGDCACEVARLEARGADPVCAREVRLLEGGEGEDGADEGCPAQVALREVCVYQARMLEARPRRLQRLHLGIVEHGAGEVGVRGERALEDGGAGGRVDERGVRECGPLHQRLGQVRAVEGRALQVRRLEARVPAGCVGQVGVAHLRVVQLRVRQVRSHQRQLVRDAVLEVGEVEALPGKVAAAHVLVRADGAVGAVRARARARAADGGAVATRSREATRGGGRDRGWRG
mmetsp:Transcript_39956/g.129366  ORF Transcript_39956/g.129366 Transcript_39956/m.129366 type:complete len:345 (+) Transcript_39956:107-1141(+)